MEKEGGDRGKEKRKEGRRGEIERREEEIREQKGGRGGGEHLVTLQDGAPLP